MARKKRGSRIDVKVDDHGTPHRPVADRFFEKISVCETSGCHMWIGSVMANGYGRFGFGPRDVRFAHRVAYELANGPIPDEAVICHRCDVPRCVNPAHLFVGSMKDNVRDMMRKKRDSFFGNTARSSADDAAPWRDINPANEFRKPGKRASA